MIGLGSSGAITQWLKSLLGTFYNLFPIGGANGGIIVRKPGTSGANDLQINSNSIGSSAGASSWNLTNLGSFSNGGTSNNIGSGNPLMLRSGVVLQTGPNNSTVDIVFGRLAAGVWGVGSSGTSSVVGAGWIQNTSGEAALAANFTNATATLNNTNLSLTVIAGRSYRITGMLQVSNSTSTEGIQLDFNGGSATATTFFVAVNAIGSVTPGTLTSTSLAGVINYSVITGTDYIMLSGYLKVNAGGTLILRFAENTSTLGTATLGAGSWIALNDTVNL